MNRIICLLFAFIFLAAFSGQKDFIYKNHTFRAAVRNVRLQSALTRQGKQDNDIVAVTVPTVLFDSPIKIPDVRKTKESFGKEIDFLVDYTKALIDGKKDDILSFWHPTSRESVKESVEDKSLAKKSQDYMTKNPGLVIIGLVKQKDSISILQDWSPGIIICITLINENGKLYLVQKPTNDLELAIIEASFKK